MSTPNNVHDLVSLIMAERQRLDALIAAVPESKRTQPTIAGYSLVDLLGHITWWENHMLDVLESAARGAQPQRLARPGEGEAWVDRVNGETFAANRDRDPATLLAEYHRNAERISTALSGYSDSQLFDPLGFANVLGYPAQAMIAANTYEHYPDHVQAISAWLDSQR